MDFKLPPDLVALQTRIRAFVTQELQPLEVETELAEGHLDPALRAALKNKLRPLNVHASSLPFEMGGTGHSWQAQAVINEEIGKVTNALGWIVWAPAIVLRHANTDQIERFVKPFATGQKDVCYAVTEAGAGSDASLMATTAVEEDGVWTLNGEKWHVTSGDVSDYMVLQAATEPEIGDGNTLFFVAMDAPGIEIIDKPKYTHNIIDGHLRLRLVDVKVEDTNRFGPVGGGLSLSKEWFLHERVMIAARCAGAARRLVDEAAQFAQERVQFGQPISEYQMIQQMLADSVTELWAARLMTFAAAQAADQAESIEDWKRAHAKASMAKLYASEMAGRVADRAVQIFGGRGYMRENVAERFFRELRVERIWEGTSEIQRIIIANSLYKRGSGALIDT